MTIKGLYLKSENFEITDTIAVPHPYCITPKHVGIASDQFSGRLGEEAIAAAEKQGVRCGMRGCMLDYKKHEQALLVSCRAPLKNSDGTVNPELRKFLLDNKPECEKHGYAGFAFIKAGGEG